MPISSLNTSSFWPSTCCRVSLSPTVMVFMAAGSACRVLNLLPVQVNVLQPASPQQAGALAFHDHQWQRSFLPLICHFDFSNSYHSNRISCIGLHLDSNGLYIWPFCFTPQALKMVFVHQGEAAASIYLQVNIFLIYFNFHHIGINFSQLHFTQAAQSECHAAYCKCLFFGAVALILKLIFLYFVRAMTGSLPPLFTVSLLSPFSDFVLLRHTLAICPILPQA